MFKKSRKILTAVLILTLITAMAVQSLYGAVITPPTIEPMWTNLGSLALDLNYDVSPMFISVVAQGLSGTTFSNGKVILKKLSGTGAGQTITWENLSANGSQFTFFDQTITPTKGTYQLTLIITASRNNYDEPINYSTSSTYSPS